MISPIQIGKTYGVLHIEGFFSFLGFVKKIGSDEIQKVDVYLDDKQIDTIEANQFTEVIDDMYDAENKAFRYNLPCEYLGQKSKISFKNHDSGDELLNSPYTLIDKNHEDFNEAIFVHSLEGNFDNEKIKNINPKDSIGFLATDDNLLNKDFIKLLNALFEKNLDTRFKVFYFNKEQKNLISEKFNKYLSKIDFIIPKDIYDIDSNTSIYIYSSTSNEKPKSLGYYKTWQVLNQTKAKTFMINIFKEIDEKEYSKSLKLVDNCKIEFEKSVVSKIFESDERYNEFRFMHSLNQPISEELKDMYCPNSIGFLATKENMEDEEFMGYIKELMERFPDVEFKEFCFNKSSNKTNSIQISSLYDITNNSCVLITNPELLNNRIDQIITQQQIKFQNIFISPFNKTNINKKIKDIVNTKLINAIKNNLEKFSLTNNDIKNISHNHVLMVRKVFEKLLEIKPIEKDVFLDLNFIELQFINIESAINNQKFIEVQKYVNSMLLNLIK